MHHILFTFCNPIQLGEYETGMLKKGGVIKIKEFY